MWEWVSGRSWTSQVFKTVITLDTYQFIINFENGHKNIFGLSVALELKVENSKILTFKVIFLCQKLTASFSIFLLMATFICAE